MIVPSIDLMDGRTVQLIGGKDKALDAGDPRPLAERFGRVGEIAVIDLDAALGRGSNATLIRDVVRLARCCVGGGIRDVETARGWLDAGAERVILGTAARPEILDQLPRERVVAALDHVAGKVVVEGWRRDTGVDVFERMHELRGHVGGFLVTFVEREGRMQGIDFDEVRALKDAAGDARLTVAGGIKNAGEIAALDELGVDAQVGMALYTGKLTLAQSLAAMLSSDREDGLWPTIVCDELGQCLGLAWSNAESLERALETGTGVYWSRERGLWEKGKTSDNTQELLGVLLDCDRDAIRFTVRQAGSGFCHLGTRSCFDEDRGLGALERTIAERTRETEPGSYTARLLTEDGLLDKKLVEEARELAEAGTQAEVAHEAADVLYFTLVAMRRGGVQLHDVISELEARARRVTRRRGDAKPEAGR